MHEPPYNRPWRRLFWTENKRETSHILCYYKPFPEGLLGLTLHLIANKSNFFFRWLMMHVKWPEESDLLCIQKLNAQRYHISSSEWDATHGDVLAGGHEVQLQARWFTCSCARLTLKVQRWTSLSSQRYIGFGPHHQSNLILHPSPSCQRITSYLFLSPLRISFSEGPFQC